MLERFAAVMAVISLSACGACNCSVPAFNGVVTPVITGGLVLPGGVAPPAPLPPAAALACSQGAGSIPLGAALAPFAILAGSTVTNTGATVVTYAAGAVTGSLNDDLVGVSPGTAVVGFYPPGAITDGPSAIYAVGAGYTNTPGVPLAAQNALTTAYNTAAGLAATTTFPGGQDLSTASVIGHPVGTLPPGVYSSPTTLAIASGNLTLDGGGNPQAVFVFQAGTALTTTLNGVAGGNVILTNGAEACNIYWQAGSSATLGGASFYGNVLALTAVTLTSSTQFTGRALARNGAVTISTASLVVNPGGS